jgi:uncharacterized C2H2 Zn-finger protein
MHRCQSCIKIFGSKKDYEKHLSNIHVSHFSSSESNAITSKKGEEYQTVRGGSDILVMKYVLVEVYESLFYAGYGRT